jgi:elongation factor Ts
MITAQQVKELRDRTGISMMDCKDALSEANGDIEKAIEILRKKSIIKAEKKSTRATNEGAIVAGGSSNNYFLIEVNTETDFAANDQEFKKFLTELKEFPILKKSLQKMILFTYMFTLIISLLL